MSAKVNDFCLFVLGKELETVIGARYLMAKVTVSSMPWIN